MNETFDAVVLDWLKREMNKPAVLVMQVSGDGTDWDGDTEGGFFSSFGVTVRWQDLNGASHWLEVTGDDMQSLWTWVVTSWRAGQC